MQDYISSDQKHVRLCKYPVVDGEREAIVDGYNQRIKLFGLIPVDLEGVDFACLLPAVPGIKEIDYSKVIVYTVEGDDEEWRLLGFSKEGIISGFFSGHVDGHIWAAYVKNARGQNSQSEAHDRIVETAVKKKSSIPHEPTGYLCEIAGSDAAEEIAVLLQESFKDYPVPLDPESIRKRLSQPDHYFRVMRDSNGEVAAVASAEIDFKRESAELSDCASAKKQRGRGLMTYLLWRIEQDMINKFGISDLYSLVRAGEIDMNSVFGKLCYQYSGRLINNCRMPQGWESVNIWCKTARAGSIGDRVDKLTSSLDPLRRPS